MSNLLLIEKYLVKSRIQDFLSFSLQLGLIVFIVVVINLPLVSCACTSNKIEFIDVIKMLSLLYMVSLGDFVGAYNN